MRQLSRAKHYNEEVEIEIYLGHIVTRKSAPQEKEQRLLFVRLK